MLWRKAILGIWRHEKAIFFQIKRMTERTCCGKFAPIRVVGIDIVPARSIFLKMYKEKTKSFLYTSFCLEWQNK